MRLAVLLACASCSFTPGAPPLALGDGSVIDGPHMGDAAHDARQLDAPRMWMTVETLTISCTGGAVISQTVLMPGVTYHLDASGTCIDNTDNDSEADADWIGFNIVRTPVDVYQSIDEGISVDDPTIDDSKQPHWGAYSPNHEYEVDWLGAGSTISVQFNSGDYSNNDGSLTVTIVALE